MSWISRARLRFTTGTPAAAAQEPEPEPALAWASEKFEAYVLGHSDVDARWYCERAPWRMREQG